MKKRLIRFVKELLIYVLVAITIALLVDWYRTKDIPKQVAPALYGQTLSGDQIDVIELSHQQPVVVYFWATWCPACKFVSPSVDWLSQYYPVVTVAGASGPNERVATFLQHSDYQFDTISDTKSALFQQWSIQVTPTIAIIRDGQVASITTGITTPPGLLARVWLNQ